MSQTDNGNIIDNVKSAILSLGKRSADGNDPDAWLVNFEKSKVAWEVLAR